MNIKKSLLLFTLFWVSLNEAFAGIQVTPAIVRIEAKGSEYEIPLTVKNTSDKEMSYLQTYLSNNIRNEDGDWVYATTSKDKVTIDWASLDKDMMEIKPGDKGDIKIIIKMKPTMTGDFNLALLLEQDQDKMREKLSTENKTGQKVGAQILPLMRVGIPIYIRKTSEDMMTIKIGSAIKYDPMEMNALTKGIKGVKSTQVIENSGIYETLVTTRCDLVHAENKAKLKSAIGMPDKIALLPKERRRVECFFPGVLPTGKYEAVNYYDLNIRNTEAVEKTSQRKEFDVSPELAQSLQSELDTGLPAPVITDVTELAEPFTGKLKPFKIKVTNPTTETLTLEPSLDLVDGENIKTSLEPEKLEIEGGKSAILTVKLDAPEDIQSVYGHLYLTAPELADYAPYELPIALKASGTEANSAMKVTGIKVEADEKYKHIKLLLSNNGADYVPDIEGEITVKTFTGQIMDKLKPAFKDTALLPGEETLIYGVSDKLEAGTYKLDVSLRDRSGKAYQQEVEAVVN